MYKGALRMAHFQPMDAAGCGIQKPENMDADGVMSGAGIVMGVYLPEQKYIF